MAAAKRSARIRQRVFFTLSDEARAKVERASPGRRSAWVESAIALAPAREADITKARELAAQIHDLAEGPDDRSADIAEAAVTLADLLVGDGGE